MPPSKLFVPVLDETKFFSVEVEVPPKRLLLVVNFFLFINVLFVWLNPVCDRVLLFDWVSSLSIRVVGGSYGCTFRW